MNTTLSSETLHASCIACDGHAVLITGRSGSGKSDLSLRMIDRGARLVSDDYTQVKRVSGRLLASAPANIAGKIEVRGLGIVDMPAVADVPIALVIDLDHPPERMPEAGHIVIAGVQLPLVTVDPVQQSAPIKIDLALARHINPGG